MTSAARSVLGGGASGSESTRNRGPEGALLVRPDRKVAWRAVVLPADPAHELRDALGVVLRGGDAPAEDPAEPYLVRIRAAASVLVR